MKYPLTHFLITYVQWRRSVVKYGCQAGSVRSSHQTVSYYTVHQWFPNTQQSRFLTAWRRLEKIVFLPFLTHVFHPWWCGTCRVIQQFWMKVWHFRRSKHTPTLLHIFRGSGPSHLPESTPLITCSHMSTFRVMIQISDRKRYAVNSSKPQIQKSCSQGQRIDMHVIYTVYVKRDSKQSYWKKSIALTGLVFGKLTPVNNKGQNW